MTYSDRYVPRAPQSKVKGKGMQKQMALEELARERRRAQVPAERWRARRAEMQREAAGSNGQDGMPSLEKAEAGEAGPADGGGKEGGRVHWKDRMADPEWRVQQRLR